MNEMEAIAIPKERVCKLRPAFLDPRVNPEWQNGTLNQLVFHPDKKMRRNTTPTIGVNKLGDKNTILTYKKFIHYCTKPISEDIQQYLRLSSFDNWQWDDAEMLTLLRQMFIDLEFSAMYHLNDTLLQEFLFEVYMHYKNVPFHNFKHCFMVTQMMYGLIWLINLKSVLTDLECFILLISSICHDLDHPGYNNTYQINARTELLLKYGNVSTLENHHYDIAMQILSNEHTGLIKHFPQADIKYVTEGMKRCILATDMSKHADILSAFRNISPDEFNVDKKDHKELLMMILIKTADISNEVRPLEVAEPWVECLLQEFFEQAYTEKKNGLPVAPFMDPDKVQKSATQCGFIKFVLLPLFEALGEKFPVITEDIIKPVQAALEYYAGQQRQLELEQEGSEKKT